MKTFIWIVILFLQLWVTKFNVFNGGQKLADATYFYALNFLESHPSSWNWFYEALLIGREEALRSQPVMQSFLIIGLFHMMVGTGTHVLALETLLLKILVFIPKRQRKFLVIFILIFFCFMNRLKPPCVRAVVGRILFFKRPLHPLLQVDLQMVITMVCLILEPSWVMSLSFQFSCGATLALAMAATFKTESSFLQKCTSALLCSAVTFPLILGIQPCVSWLVVPTNTIALPLFEGVFMPITLINVIFHPISPLTERILSLVFGISDYLAHFERPLVCFDERKLASWGLIYLTVVYLVWRFALPWFFRRRFWRNQSRLETK